MEAPLTVGEEATAETAQCYVMAEIGMSSGSVSSETSARTAAYLSSWRQAILDDPKALMTAFAEAEKAADWVMNATPFSWRPPQSWLPKGQAMGLGHGAELGAIQTRDIADPLRHSAWGMPVNASPMGRRDASPTP